MQIFLLSFWPTPTKYPTTKYNKNTSILNKVYVQHQTTQNTWDTTPTTMGAAASWTKEEEPIGGVGYSLYCPNLSESDSSQCNYSSSWNFALTLKNVLFLFSNYIQQSN